MANAATQRLSGGSAEKRTGNAIPSRYVSMSQSFSKQANNLWLHIYQVVWESCSSEYKGATPANVNHFFTLLGKMFFTP